VVEVTASKAQFPVPGPWVVYRMEPNNKKMLLPCKGVRTNLRRKLRHYGGGPISFWPVFQ